MESFYRDVLQNGTATVLPFAQLSAPELFDLRAGPIEREEQGQARF
jgi:hypothetical protein